MQRRRQYETYKAIVDGVASSNGYLMQFQADDVPVDKPEMIEVLHSVLLY
jgi:glycerol kinase